MSELHELLAMLKMRGLALREKQSSWPMRLLGKLLEHIAPGFMDHYITVIGSTIWIPSQRWLADDPARSVRVLVHELVHDEDRSARLPLSFELTYLFPQILALGALLAIPGSLLHLLWLLALLPWPAPWRAFYEARGYAAQHAMSCWQRGKPLDASPPGWIIDKFVRSPYLWMLPSRKLARWLVRRELLRIQSGRMPSVLRISQKLLGPR